MKMKKIAGLCILIPVLLSGCGSQQSAQTAAAGTSQPQQQNEQAPADAKQKSQDRPVMNQAQRQMFSTFQTLLMLDKADGLAITKEQAQAMLPVAQEIVAKAELSDENKTKLFEKLTEAQKKFVEDSTARMSNRGNKTPDASAQPNAKGSDETDSGKQPNNKGANGTGGGNANNNNRGGNANGNRPANGAMRDPGKQLIELLQNKIK
ncbi:hypothetical protein SAMN04487897_102765 [Paenibacillus sp. yr247]|uniref:hypothetical protein n=1 Tax=Paenibacillus sp. yr247 TaxID=1761880 RepID=UPI00088DCB5A|nr:hypothetical protein [Paenibacillus sp. yr247]SDN39478.1 hypothetical protein SAMN04487897_102765 [Paenibacillus sp. yr247]